MSEAETYRGDVLHCCLYLAYYRPRCLFVIVIVVP